MSSNDARGAGQNIALDFRVNDRAQILSSFSLDAVGTENAPVVQPQTWQCFELFVLANTSDGRLEAWVDGVSFSGEVRGNIGNGVTLNRMRLGIYQFPSDPPDADLLFDDFTKDGKL